MTASPLPLNWYGETCKAAWGFASRACPPPSARVWRSGSRLTRHRRGHLELLSDLDSPRCQEICRNCPAATTPIDLTPGRYFRRTVLARHVKAGVRQHESVNRLSAYDVRLDNLIHIAESDPAVPNSIRIDEEIRAGLALIKATRLIGPYLSLKSTFRQLLFE